MIVQSVHELIGQTPLIRINSISGKNNGVNVYGKLEAFNPGFSVKDRSAYQLLKQARIEGKLKEGYSVVESTSGNMGHALAMLCAELNYHFICILDPKTPQSNIALIRAFGGEVVIVDTPDKTGGFQKKRIEVARSIAKERLNCINLDQYNNPSAIVAHKETTAPEIQKQLNNSVDVIFGAVSTGSHLSGIAQYFKTQSDTTTIIGVEPQGSVIFGGHFKAFLQNGTGLSFVPGNFQGKYIDRLIKVADLDAFDYCRKLAQQDGLLLGGSSGSLAFAAHQYAQNCTSPCNIVIICADSGLKYLDTVYNDEWIEQQQLQRVS
ncbi:MAG: cysteine synthase family protein [Pseudomonadales bacterium]|nr:cysteine synthase family protein [Pseudomonadales bacterium]